ncbi:hypothetical protein Ddc_13396 [Ditylenchus destructor]|nr:hypothetical protein Ddc_13396 [Ditylenchus destructor]
MLKTAASVHFRFAVLFESRRIGAFTIICRPLKNFIERYFCSKPNRIFDELRIRGGSYALFHKDVQWHPNQSDYSVQRFLDAHECMIDKLRDPWNDHAYYSFAEMRPYLGPSVRITKASIYIAGNSTFNPEHIKDIESISYIWRDGNIEIRNAGEYGSRIVAEDFQPILNSPTILQCRLLKMENAYFLFKDFKVLYTVNVIEINYFGEDEIDLRHQCWPQFFEHPGLKPLVVFSYLRGFTCENFKNLQDQLSKAFSSAVSSNVFKIVFALLPNDEPLIEFRNTNKVSGDKLELRKGFPTEYQPENLDEDCCYILECSSI